jgi:hypothetical protein
MRVTEVVAKHHNYQIKEGEMERVYTTLRKEMHTEFLWEILKKRSN